MATRSLVGWDIGIFVYLITIYAMMIGSKIRDIQERASIEDEGSVAILVLTAAAALASIGAIVVELGGAHNGRSPEPMQLMWVILTIFLSWTFIHTIFALHYAHEFYGEGLKASGLNFPGEEKPDYWDFVYFSFVVGMTFQVSDVAVTSRSIRKTVVAHGIVSFLFNVALLALIVNIAASAL